MAITDRTRKTLWAKSGNRCALCKVELVQRKSPPGGNQDVIVGQECHMVPKNNRTIEPEHDLDCYDNLILLCANDHKKTHDQADFYSSDKLRSIKNVHEDWVASRLKTKQSPATKKISIKRLPRITSGKELLDVVLDSGLADYSYEELKTENEVREISGLFDTLKDYSYVLSDMSFTEIAKMELELNDNIERVSKIGFSMFGAKSKVRYGDIPTYIALLRAVRKLSSAIVEDSMLVSLPISTRKP